MIERYRSRPRGLLLLQLFASVGILLGPLLGGFLSSNSYTRSLQSYPYALPNLLSAACYALAALGTLLLVDETLDSFHGPNNRFLERLWLKVRGVLPRVASKHVYSVVLPDEPVALTDCYSIASPGVTESVEPQQKLPFRHIWTSQVICTLLAHFMIAGHITTFSTLWVIFLSSPVSVPSTSDQPGRHLNHSLTFAGGVGLEPSSIGILMFLTGVFGLLLQLILYPRLKNRFRIIRIWRVALWIFPVAYFFAPFPALVASSFDNGGESTTDASKTAAAVWASIAGVVILFMGGRTGATAAMPLLINDCVPAPSARATMNVAGTVVGNLSRSLFPVAALAFYGWGLRQGVVAIGFWALVVLAMAAVVASWWVGNGEVADNVSRIKHGDEENEDVRG